MATYGSRQRQHGHAQTTQMAEMPSSKDLRKPLRAGQPSNEDTEEIGPVLRIPWESVENNRRHKHDEQRPGEHKQHNGPGFILSTIRSHLAGHAWSSARSIGLSFLAGVVDVKKHTRNHPRRQFLSLSYANCSGETHTPQNKATPLMTCTIPRSPAIQGYVSFDRQHPIST